MKTISFLLAAAGLVAAQNLEGEPACATPCLMTAISSVCGAQATDQACACASQGAVGQAAVSCLLANCDSDELVQAQSAGAALCVSYSATAGSGTASMTSMPTSMATTGSGSGSGNVSSLSTTATANSTITSSASLTTDTSSSSSTRSTSASSGTSSASGSAASSSSTAAAAVMQGPTVVGAGLLGLFVAGVAAL